MSCYKLKCAACLVLLLAMQLAGAYADELKPRLMVLTDIGGDPDDQQSLIRLLLYSNEFEIEGLVATASGTPGELKEAVTRPELIRQIVEAYGQVQPNLAKHATGYPAADTLLSRIKVGNPRRGLDQVGADRDTEGSNWIIRAADSSDPRPLNVTIWGGQTDFAQALWRVRHDRGAAGLQSFIAKLRIFDIDDQDRIQPWIFENFPDLFYILSKAPPKRDKREGAYRGMYLGGDESLTSLAWLDEHVRNHHGPLGALYPPKTWTEPNPNGALKEGDTPSWFYFRPTALHDSARPDWGGWGGRFRRQERGLWRDVPDSVGEQLDPRASVWRWRPFFQRDFQARLDWCVKDVASANHPPEVEIDGVSLTSPVIRKAKALKPLRVMARASDRDGNTLTYRWWIYMDAGTYDRSITLASESAPTMELEIPADAAGKSLHIVLEVTDDGSPPLAALARVVVQIE